jgi:hypothetical protein
MTASKWLKLLISTALGLAVCLMPAMAGLSRTGQTLLAIAVHVNSFETPESIIY